jgi:hypothetical protein
MSSLCYQAVNRPYVNRRGPRMAEYGLRLLYKVVLDGLCCKQKVGSDKTRAMNSWLPTAAVVYQTDIEVTSVWFKTKRR